MIVRGNSWKYEVMRYNRRMKEHRHRRISLSMSDFLMR